MQQKVNESPAISLARRRHGAWKASRRQRTMTASRRQTPRLPDETSCVFRAACFTAEAKTLLRLRQAMGKVRPGDLLRPVEVFNPAQQT